MLKKLILKLYRNMQEYDITLEELKLKQSNGAIIIDVRNQREYQENHISKSINIPEYEIKNTIQNVVKNKSLEIVLYCSSGYRSLKGCKTLKKMGYTNVYNLYGGLENY